MKKEGIFTEAIEEPQPPRSFNLGRKVKTRELPKEGMNQGEIENELEKMKPDASPREFLIEMGEEYSTETTYDKIVELPAPQHLQDWMLNKIHVIEKSAYDALAKELASYQKQVDINQKLVSELAASKAENIGNLQLIGGMDERIKELEADNLLALGIADKFANERDEMKVREQKLVAALESVVGHDYGKADIFDTMKNTVDEALKAHKGGA